MSLRHKPTAPIHELPTMTSETYRALAHDLQAVLLAHQQGWPLERAMARVPACPAEPWIALAKALADGDMARLAELVGVPSDAV